jgi:ADP-ribose pyrophosphatase YjhB (NUDIX family)
MLQMYTIFINDIPIYLTDELIDNDNINFYKYDETNLNETLNKLEKGELNSIYFYHANLSYLWNDFKNNFKIIEAAGGIVFNEKEELLWIYRNDKWDLPKGKIEKGEEKAVAAIREVQEECGIEELQIIKFVATTYHIYRYKGELILKFTYWYKMFSNSMQNLVPQKEEGITKVAWLHKTTMKEALEDTYDNIKLLFKVSSI